MAAELTDEDLARLEQERERLENTTKNNKLTGPAKQRLKRKRKRSRIRTEIRRGEARS